MEGSPSSCDDPSEYMPPAESPTASESELGKAELIAIDYLRLGYRNADRKGADPARKKARRNSYTPAQMEIIRVAYIDRNRGYMGGS